MRNADYVGQNGFKQHIPLNDIVIANSQFEIAKVQSENPLFHWVLDPQSKTSVAYQILVSGDLNTLEKIKETYGIVEKLRVLFFPLYT